MKNVAIIGMGSHAKKLYLNYLKKHKLNLALVVELESKKDSISKYLKEKGFENTKIFTIEDEDFELDYLKEEVASNLLAICNLLEITSIIISTDAKAHHMYLDFALKNDINVLTDTPILVTKGMTDLANIKKIQKQYYEILDLAKTSKSNCKVMCERKYHKGYEKVKEILYNIVNEHQVPITYITLYANIGKKSSFKDYQYGYGSLYNNGYHFIDLLSDFIKINNILGPNQLITNGEVYSKVLTLNDENSILDDKNDYKQYGEKDYHGLLTFYNDLGNPVTTANLNLLTTNTSNNFKHERIDLKIGDIMDIQIHSYQTKGDKLNEVGGQNHFDIYIFDNTNLAKPFKVIHIDDLYNQGETLENSNYEELAKEKFLNEFFYNKNCSGDIKDQELSISILTACSKGIYNHYHNRNKVEMINISNEQSKLNTNYLKKYFNFFDKPLKEDVINQVTHYYNMYQLHIMELYLPSKDCYKVYIKIDDDKKVEDGILSKAFKNKIVAYVYFKYLVYITKNKKMHKIIKTLEK